MGKGRLVQMEIQKLFYRVFLESYFSLCAVLYFETVKETIRSIIWRGKSLHYIFMTINPLLFFEKKAKKSVVI